ncbi:arsenate reductase, glutathione/glutaredoxin type [Chroococcidiopsis sp. FACHB-1243]|uniref:arsenate reductase, glutathione/glutaredoxin type n=1 Tax=Chroococcidiopsis sp. [FACHB-1243] TaxID=2692781 RepID=UPI00177B185D|nr:arsenate reductase, glutathione/glutaredoxin type [Chroococcidiopsis sp. [FACHB-1243]]MBD2305880.1 arsenate reductase, glutathione/glutaredoxin type [Chroococcidiopsis sp. [FACHB-1243]]
MKRVMFVCKTNSRRSQMAEGFARQLSAGKIQVMSAGLETNQIDPLAIQVMSEVGIDISSQTSKPLHNFNPEDYDVVISLCGCGVNLPESWVLREVFQDWQLEDPQGQSIETFRQVRSQIKERVEQLIQSFSTEKANI